MGDFCQNGSSLPEWVALSNMPEWVASDKRARMGYFVRHHLVLLGSVFSQNECRFCINAEC